MRIQVENNILTFHLGLTVIVTFAVGVFCYIVNFSLIIPLILLLTGLYLFYSKKASVRLFLNLGLLLALIVFTSHALTEYKTVSRLYIPVASVSMLTILLYNDVQLGFIMSFVSSSIVGLMVGYDFPLMLIFFLGSLTASFCVREIRTRGELLTAGVLVGIIQVVCAVLLNPSMSFLLTQDFLTSYLKPLLLNGIISAVVAIAASFVFEVLFGALTNFRLLELSDFNQPLLKKMIIEAPGTYQHSLMVSNLSEAAANAIGANALLTRVGAYYHDIGKMIKPEYFTENQLFGTNKHDHLEPSMSRLVILNHVKEGVELARKHRLNQRIIDFIPQHHGTSLIHYFYQRALEEANHGEKIDESNFRYPGPKPQSRETAIVMLADSTEGAVRALEDPAPNRIDEVVRRVINNRFIDGQLDECDLTLKDMERICATFTHVLSAMYHSRIKYPEKKNGNGHNHKKSSEKNSSESLSNHKDNKKNSSP